MNQRFEILVEPKGYNIFLIDDFLRTIRSHEERLRLINTVGYSEEKRDTFERERGLPHGAVELALMCEDKQVVELNAYVNNRLTALYDRKASREEINEALMEAGSRGVGIKALYPDAFQFLAQYGAMARRSSSAFRGDYRFNNEYKLMQVDCTPTSDANSCSPVNYCTSINYVVFIYGVAAVAAVLAFAIWIWAVAFVIP
jgi:hypothetical protein